MKEGARVRARGRSCDAPLRSERRFGAFRGFASGALALLLAVPVSAPVAPADAGAASATGSWRVTGSMSVPRHAGFTATLLADGRVLVAGGNGRTADLAAEVYDGVSGTWTRTGAITEPRTGHVAARLRDGRVLVVGGRGPVTNGPMRTAELYDPRAGRWAPTTSPREAHGGGTATVLATGTVLVAGGNDCCGGGNPQAAEPTVTVEIYDPRSGTWAEGPPLASPRLGHTATALPDGTVLVAGGTTVGGSSLASAERYDPGALGGGGARPPPAPVPAMSEHRAGHSATRLRSGLVLVAGGGPGTAELYDPVTNRWRPAGGFAEESYAHQAVLLGDGRVLGMSRGSQERSAAVQVYDPRAKTWTPGAPLVHERDGSLVTAPLPEGSVLVVGGGEDRQSAEVYSYSVPSGGPAHDDGNGRLALALLAAGAVVTAVTVLVARRRRRAGP